MNKDIKKSIDDIFLKLKESKLYNNYLNVIKQLKSNKEIMELLDTIKRYQKIATNNKDDVLEKDIKELYNKLNSIPLYQSYINIKEDLEEEIYQITCTFDNYFKDILNVDK